MGNKASLEFLRSNGMDATRELSGQEQSEIVRRVREAQAADGISNETIAQILQCSSSTWSQIRNGKYAGDTESYLRAARSWLDRKALGAEVPDTTFVKTSIAHQIMMVCSRAWSMPTVGLVITPTGLGKTSALREVKRTHGRRCIYVQAGQMMRTPLGLLGELALQLNVSVPPTTCGSAIYQQVRSRLAGMYAKGLADSPLVLIDEATTLTPGALNMLRNLHDDPACRPGIVLADTWRLDRELKTRRVRGMAGGYEQLTGRSGVAFSMDARSEIRQADVTKVAKSIMASIGFDGRVGPSTYAYLASLARRAGGFRNVLHRLWVCNDLAENLGHKARFTVEELDAVAPMVGDECTMEHSAPGPFGRPALSAKPSRLTKSA